MAISLKKGQRISLTKEAPGLKQIMCGLGWDVAQSFGARQIDLDSSVICLNADKKLTDIKNIIYFGHLRHSSDAIAHQGDNLTGAGEGDDEIIDVNLRTVPPEVAKMAIAVTIHEAEQRKQNFGQVSNAFVRIVNCENEKEIIRYDLTEDYSIETALIMAELYRKDGEWRMNALGSGYEGGLQALLDRYQS